MDQRTKEQFSEYYQKHGFFAAMRKFHHSDIKKPLKDGLLAQRVLQRECTNTEIIDARVDKRGFVLIDKSYLFYR